MASSWFHNLRRLNRHNVETLRAQPWAEISGSLGDLGTLLPLMIALAAQGSIDLGSTLVFSGLFNILTGVFYGIPLPVQPMKAIAAAAISEHGNSSMGAVTAAGQWVGAAVLFMSVTGLLRVVVNFVPVPVVRGIQIGAGLSLIIGAGSSMLKPLHWAQPALDNRIWAIAAFLVLIGTQKLPRFPYALLFFIIALVFAFIQVLISHNSAPWFHVWHPHFNIPNWTGHSFNALWMAIGQLPLTTLNSIIAVSALSQDLLPTVPTPSVTSIGISVGLMNLSATWFGGMPMCHGAGGLAAQYRFGARSGGSIIILGTFKVLLGLIFGETLVDLLGHYPKSLLGIMVLAAGLELAKVGQSLNQGAPDLVSTAEGQDYDPSSGRIQYRKISDGEQMERWTVMMTTVAGLLAFHNDAVGFLAGMLCYGAYRLSDYIAALRSRRGRFPAERDSLLRRA